MSYPWSPAGARKLATVLLCGGSLCGALAAGRAHAQPAAAASASVRTQVPDAVATDAGAGAESIDAGSAMPSPDAETPRSAAPAPGAAAAQAASPGPVAPPVAPAQSQPRERTAQAEASTADAYAQAAADTIAASNTTAEESRISLYGFADFSYAFELDKSKEIYTHPTFSVGHLNLYMASELGDGWRSLAEVRFLYLPNGSGTAWAINTGSPGDYASARLAAASYNVALARTNTTVPDYTEPAGVQNPVRWGGIEIQRAWIEYTQSELLTIRMGQFLTPYGIWNVDHGSPVLIGTHMPYVVAAGLFPQSQTGIEVYGTLNVKATQIGYHLTLSNGRGPIDQYMDLDSNKALGGRLYLKNDSLLGTITLGASAYRGEYTDSSSQYGLDASGYGTVVEMLKVQYDEFSLAGDVKWEWGGLLAQGELIMNEVAYHNGARPLSFFGNSLQADYRQWGAYGLLGYRTPFYQIMPYIAVEHYDMPILPVSSPPSAIWLGLNVRPTARVVLKAQYSYASVHGDFSKNYAFQIVETQVAWSF